MTTPESQGIDGELKTDGEEFRQHLLNQAVAHIAASIPGGLSFKLSEVLKDTSESLLIEACPETDTLVIRATDCKTALAYLESLNETVN